MPRHCAGPRRSARARRPWWRQSRTRAGRERRRRRACNARPPRSGRLSLPGTGRQRPPRVPGGPGQPPAPGGGCARSGSGSPRPAPPPAWQGAVAPPRWTVVDRVRPAPGSRPPRRLPFAARNAWPPTYSTNGRARNWGYDQIGESGPRLFPATVALAGLMPVLPAQAAEPHVLVATLDGVINPITDNYISNAVDRAVSNHDTALIIQMDTPGGLDTSMRDIIKKMLGARVPVVIFVSPSGARAASAGMYITEAADIAVMAPGTNIGSAHPVSIGGSNPAPNPSATPGTAATAVPDIESIQIEN